MEQKSWNNKLESAGLPETPEGMYWSMVEEDGNLRLRLMVMKPDVYPYGPGYKPDRYMDLTNLYHGPNQRVSSLDIREAAVYLLEGFKVAKGNREWIGTAGASETKGGMGEDA